MLKAILLTTSLSLLACQSLAPFPEVNQCAFSDRFNKFRCCNSRTKKCLNYRLESAEARAVMNGAQCLPINDEFGSYQRAENYARYLEQQARTRCQ